MLARKTILNSIRWGVLGLCLQYGWAFSAFADDQVVELADMNMEDLMKMTIASRTPLTEQESPGIVSVITAQEIQNSGARDLVDVLRMVPGFQFASDFNGTLGMGVRGLWGLEGKVLFMLDGQSLSDLYYNSVLFGDRLPLDQISRIEIIRGPGSAIYGNQAEYAVINVITYTGEELGGAKATVTFGRFPSTHARTQVSLAFGKKYGESPEDLNLSIKAYLAQSQRSDQQRLYPNGDLFNMYDAYKTTPQHLNIGASYKKFSLRLIVDRVSQFAQDESNIALSAPSEFRFDNYIGSLKYEWNISSRLKAVPEYAFSSSYPYYNLDRNIRRTDGAISTISYFDIFVLRHKVTLPFSYDPTESLNIVGGIDSYWDIGGAGPVNGYFDPKTNDPNASPTNTISSKSAYYNNTALFAQGILSSKIVNVTAGARLENHSTFGTSFVPRVGLTKVAQPWHFKFLFSRAFRYPSIGNINDAASAGATVEPERTRIFEFEAGYRLSSKSSLILNLFDILVDRPIVYLQATQSYGNFDTTGSRGFELVYKNNGRWGFTQIGYAFYSANGFIQVPRFIVSQDSTQLAAFSPHKIFWNTSLQLSKSLQVNPQLIWLSSKYTYSSPLNSSSMLTSNPVDASFLVNIFVNYNDLLWKNFDLGVGVFDVFNSNYSYPTAYDLGRNPMPGPSREVILRAGYRVSL